MKQNTNSNNTMEARDFNNMYNKTMKNMMLLCTLCAMILLCSCSNKEKEQQEKLIQQAEAIVLKNETSNASTIENTIDAIKDHLIQYPNSKKETQLKEYIEQLNRCLDYHKINDYSRRYEELTNEVYSSVNDAIKEQYQFLDEFTSEYGRGLLSRESQLQQYVRDIQKLKQEFENMKQFFDQEFSGLSSFNESVRYKNATFNNSQFASVRRSWEEIQGTQRKQEAEKELNKKVDNFEQYLKNDAEHLCEYNYQRAGVFGNAGFNVDVSHPTQTISIGTPVAHDSYNAKVCEGVFRVNMKGAMVGLDKGTVKISVKGMIVVIVDGDQIQKEIRYENIDYTILETTGQVK